MAGDDEVGGNIVGEDELGAGAGAGVDAGGEGWYQKLINGVSSVSYTHLTLPTILLV